MNILITFTLTLLAIYLAAGVLLVWLLNRTDGSHKATLRETLRTILTWPRWLRWLG